MKGGEKNFVNPLGDKKDICKHIREAINFNKQEKVLKDNEEVSLQLYREFTDLKEIEKLVFDRLLNKEKELFIVRLYIATRRPRNFTEKFQAFFANMFTEVGTAHLAVQVNDKLIHWFDCGLALVQPFEGSNATAVFYPQSKDGDEVYAVENTEENRQKICKVIQLYNCTKTYNASKVNCQTFTQDIFKELGFKSNFSNIEGPLGFYIKHITKQGNKEIFPCLVDKQGKIMKHQGRDLLWKNHQDLDDWCDDEHMETFEAYSSLLKAFHRAFQLREKYAEKMGEEHYKSDFCRAGLPTMFSNRQLPADEFYDHVNTNTSFKQFLSGSNYSLSSESSSLNLLKNDN